MKYSYVDFLELLKRVVYPHLVIPNVTSGNDLDHEIRVLNICLKEVREIIPCNEMELTIAVMLHELDRSKSMEGWLKYKYPNMPPKESFRIYLQELLSQADFGKMSQTRINFSPPSQEKIIDTIMRHSKKDEPDDPALLTVFMTGDKLDRLGSLGLPMAALHRGLTLPLFNPAKPFGYASASTAEPMLSSVVLDWLRVFEWPKMMPEKVRHLALKPGRLPARVAAFRQMAKEICSSTNTDYQLAENDLRWALGDELYKLYPVKK